ncbi:ribokinase [Halarchaeum sp. P4]|uniref:ribokinase n=1 Tax=Halarchaeum sp. P4 TaxID=3421639 RepID=UPI003EBC0FA7
MSIVVVGSYVAGLTMQVERFPVVGETISASSFAEGAGGKGSNQAVAVSRLGVESAFVGRLGDDRYAEDAEELWEREGVDAEHAEHVPGATTGVAFILVDDQGENQIVVAGGANDTLGRTEVEAARDAIADADVLLTQLEIPVEAAEAALDVANDVGTTAILNPAPGHDLPSDVVAKADYLTPNESEARVVAGREPDDDVDDETVARELREMGAGTVVLTQGPNGAIALTADGVESVPAPSVDVVDPTGAGDAFNAGFAVGLHEGMSLADAMAFGCRVGSLATTEEEVVPALPERAAVEALEE